ncbi:hypothetical protein NAEGRDRAFT_78439 [Naegleria gruberi]|uniref:DUF4116 domain-containing protein n=1 Tax=Naegleria gruberi TaxID=5762 RepID=D2V3P8_NAEGR|nr:uncharacterized protein NAEGRDRAFT_78439 [Naegleria gruberi]EFC48810.1 hypothetical protein NAEGRDRAFT_78439 [Naegleria gruberi]|eukprot:XP_002681554.1 hypothetical protein NAEGRDRAFT_78439 [Naegleria gruberi strain NEG-M]
MKRKVSCGQLYWDKKQKNTATITNCHLTDLIIITTHGNQNNGDTPLNYSELLKGKIMKKSTYEVIKQQLDNYLNNRYPNFERFDMVKDFNLNDEVNYLNRIDVVRDLDLITSFMEHELFPSCFSNINAINCLAEWLNLWQYRSFVLRIVGKDSTYFQYAFEKWENDFEIVLTAIKHNGSTLQYASNELRNNSEIVMAAIKENRSAFQYASNELRYDREFIISALKQDANIIDYVPDELKKNQQILDFCSIINCEIPIYTTKIALPYRIVTYRIEEPNTWVKEANNCLNIINSYCRTFGI